MLLVLIQRFPWGRGNLQVVSSIRKVIARAISNTYEEAGKLNGAQRPGTIKNPIRNYFNKLFKKSGSIEDKTELLICSRYERKKACKDFSI